jgi:hypothetical protein
MAETELGQSAHALPQMICFWWIRSGKVKNFRSGLFQVHRRSPNFSAGFKSGNSCQKSFTLVAPGILYQACCAAGYRYSSENSAPSIKASA